MSYNLRNLHVTESPNGRDALHWEVWAPASDYAAIAYGSTWAGRVHGGFPHDWDGARGHVWYFDRFADIAIVDGAITAASTARKHATRLDSSDYDGYDFATL